MGRKDQEVKLRDKAHSYGHNPTSHECNPKRPAVQAPLQEDIGTEYPSWFTPKKTHPSPRVTKGSKDSRLHPDRQPWIARQQPRSSNTSRGTDVEFGERPPFRNTTSYTDRISPRPQNSNLDSPVRQLSSPLRRITMDSNDENKRYSAEADAWTRSPAKNKGDSLKDRMQGSNKKRCNWTDSTDHGAFQAGAPTQQPIAQWVQEMAAFDTDRFLEGLGIELQSKPKTYQPLPEYMQPYVMGSPTPAPMDLDDLPVQPAKDSPEPTYELFHQFYPINRKSGAIISDDEKDDVMSEVEQTPEEIIVGNTIKPLVRKGMDYDPAVKDLFKYHDNVYVNKKVDRRTAAQMIAKIDARKAVDKETTVSEFDAFSPGEHKCLAAVSDDLIKMEGIKIEEY